MCCHNSCCALLPAPSSAVAPRSTYPARNIHHPTRITLFQAYVKQLRHEYDDLRNAVRKAKARLVQEEHAKAPVLYQVEENRQAVQRLAARRQELNEQYGAHLDSIAVAEQQGRSWNFMCVHQRMAVVCVCARACVRVCGRACVRVSSACVFDG